MNDLEQARNQVIEKEEADIEVKRQQSVSCFETNKQLIGENPS